MTISMYHASIPQFKKMLTNLSELLKVAEAFITDKKVPEKVLLGSRIYIDMFDLTKQVQVACDQAKNGMARLAGVEPPKMDDSESSIADLHARIATTIHFLDTLSKEAVDASASKAIQFSIRDHHFEFIGDQYLITWILPNFYFHITTAYNILRHNGIAIGKRDFIG